MNTPELKQELLQQEYQLLQQAEINGMRIGYINSTTVDNLKGYGNGRKYSVHEIITVLMSVVFDVKLFIPDDFSVVAPSFEDDSYCLSTKINTTQEEMRFFECDEMPVPFKTFFLIKDNKVLATIKFPEHLLKIVQGKSCVDYTNELLLLFRINIPN